MIIILYPHFLKIMTQLKVALNLQLFSTKKVVINMLQKLVEGDAAPLCNRRPWSQHSFERIETVIKYQYNKGCMLVLTNSGTS